MGSSLEYNEFIQSKKGCLGLMMIAFLSIESKKHGIGSIISDLKVKLINIFQFSRLVHNGSPVSAVRLNGDKRAIFGCLNEVGNLSFIKMPAWHLPAC
jgi:hypothetical protein